MKSNVADNIYNLKKGSNSFLSLNEIYTLYKEKYDVSKYTDFESAIRRGIYGRWKDRDLLSNNRNILFVSLQPKKTRGNKYGLIEWYEIQKEEDIINNDLDNLSVRLVDDSIFDEDEPILQS